MPNMTAGALDLEINVRKFLRFLFRLGIKGEQPGQWPGKKGGHDTGDESQPGIERGIRQSVVLRCVWHGLRLQFVYLEKQDATPRE